METSWGPVKRDARVLTLLDGAVEAGAVTVWFKYADEEDDPFVRLDLIRVEDPYKGTGVSLELVKVVVGRWATARVVAGPLGNDDPPGPRFRLRAWDAGIPIHDDRCERERCSCRRRVVAEVVRRWREWAAQGGISKAEAEAKIASLDTKEGLMVDISGFDPPYACMAAGCDQEATLELEWQSGDVVTRNLRLCQDHADQGPGTTLITGE